MRARDVVGVGEVGEVVLADPARAVAVEHRAHREQRVGGVAGDDVGAAGAVLVQQAAAVRVAALDLGGVARVVGHDRARRGPSPTSGRPACRRCRRAAGRPGRRRSATTSRSPSASAGGCRRAASGPGWARCRRGSRVAARRGRGRRSRGSRPRARRGRPPAAAVRARRLTTLRYQKSSSSMASSEVTAVLTTVSPNATTIPDAEAVDLTPGSIARDGPHDRAVEHQHAEPEREHRERQRDPDQERPDQRVDQPDQRPPPPARRRSP